MPHLPALRVLVSKQRPRQINKPMVKLLNEVRLGICIYACLCNHFIWDRSASEKSIGAGQYPPKPKAKLLALAYRVPPVLAQPHVYIHLPSFFPIYKALTTLVQSLYTSCSSALKVISGVGHPVFHEERLSPQRLLCPSPHPRKGL